MAYTAGMNLRTEDRVKTKTPAGPAAVSGTRNDTMALFPEAFGG